MPTLYLDNDVTVHAAPLLEAAGHAVHTTAQYNRRATTDDDQLLFAAQQGWILVAHNWQDFRLLHGAWQLWARAWGVTPVHAGILVVRPAPERDIAARVVDFFATHDRRVIENALWRHTAAAGWVAFPAT